MTDKAGYGTGRNTSDAPPRRSARRAVVAGVAAAGTLAVAGFLALFLISEAQGPGVSGFEEADGRALFRTLEQRMPEARAVTIDDGKTSITFRRDGAAWTHAESDGYPTQDGAVDGFLKQLASTRAAYVSADAEPDYAAHGVNEPGSPPGPATVIAVEAGDDTIARAAIGHTFSVPGMPDGGAFLRIGAEKRIWLADRPLTPSTRPDDWLNEDILDIAPGSVRRLTVSGVAGERIVMTRDDSGSFRIAEGLPDGVEIKGSWVYDALSRVFEALKFEAVRKATALPDEAERVRRVEVETTDGLRYRAQLISTGGDPAQAGTTAAATARETWATFSAELRDDDGTSPGDRRHAERFNARHSGWAYILPVSRLDSLSMGSQDIVK